jgi:hypothetical protein
VLIENITSQGGDNELDGQDITLRNVILTKASGSTDGLDTIAGLRVTVEDSSLTGFGASPGYGFLINTLDATHDLSFGVYDVRISNVKFNSCVAAPSTPLTPSIAIDEGPEDMQGIQNIVIDRVTTDGSVKGFTLIPVMQEVPPCHGGPLR